MTRIKTLIALSLFGLLAACGGPGENAQVPEAQPAGATFIEAGDWVVHFNAMTTDQLSPEMATAYEITRSNDRPMVTLSVLRADDNSPVRADIELRAVNLTDQVKTFTVRMEEEQDAIYYLGFSRGTRVVNQETLRFEVSVTPEGATESTEFSFTRQFYTDG